MLYGRLLDNNSYRCESLTDLPYPAVLLQRRESGSDRFIECLGADLYRVLNVSDILYRDCACSENHTAKRSIFAVYSPARFAVFASTKVSLQAPPLQLQHSRVSGAKGKAA